MTISLKLSFLFSYSFLFSLFPSLPPSLLPCPTIYYMLSSHLYCITCICISICWSVPSVPTSLHLYLMYHYIIYAYFPVSLHIYSHTLYVCLSSINTRHSASLYSRLNSLSNQVAFLLWLASVVYGYHLRTTSPFLDKSQTPSSSHACSS